MDFFNSKDIQTLISSKNVSQLENIKKLFSTQAYLLNTSFLEKNKDIYLHTLSGLNKLTGGNKNVNKSFSALLSISRGTGDIIEPQKQQEQNIAGTENANFNANNLDNLLKETTKYIEQKAKNEVELEKIVKDIANKQAQREKRLEYKRSNLLQDKTEEYAKASHARALELEYLKQKNKIEYFNLVQRSKKQEKEDREQQAQRAMKKAILWGVARQGIKTATQFAPDYWMANVIGNQKETLGSAMSSITSPYTTLGETMGNIRTQQQKRLAYKAIGQIDPRDIAKGLHPLMTDEQKIAQLRRISRSEEQFNYFAQEAGLLEIVKSKSRPNGEQQSLIDKVIGSGMSVAPAVAQIGIASALGGLVARKGLIGSLKSVTVGGAKLAGKALPIIGGVYSADRAYDAYQKGDITRGIYNTIASGLLMASPFVPVGGVPMAVAGTGMAMAEDTIFGNHKQEQQPIRIVVEADDNIIERKMTEIANKVFDNKMIDSRLNVR